MKNILIIAVIVTFLSSFNSFGQTESTIKYYYAQVFITETSQGKNARINFGEDYPIIVDQKDEITKKVSSFKNVIDIMNYLSDQDWEYVENDFEIRVMNDNVRESSSVFSYYTFKKVKPQIN